MFKSLYFNMKKIYFLSLLLTLLTVKASACLNEYYTTNVSGHRFEYDGEREISYEPFVCEFDSLSLRARLDSLIALNPSDFKIKSDIAVCELKLGLFEKGLRTFVSLNKSHPKEYRIISNLGTAYELVGKLDSALKYIEKGYEMNKSSHRGSQYVHVLILKAKIGFKKDVNYFKTNSIFNTNMEESITLKSKYYVNLRRREFHIKHQLEERLPFTPKTDIVMGQILKELGDLQAYCYSMRNGYKSYQLAKRYDPKSVILDRRITRLESKSEYLRPDKVNVLNFVEFCRQD